MDGDLELLGRLGLALVLSAAIGLESELRQKSARARHDRRLHARRLRPPVLGEPAAATAHGAHHGPGDLPRRPRRAARGDRVCTHSGISVADIATQRLDGVLAVGVDRPDDAE